MNLIPLKDLFDISYGNQFDKNKMLIDASSDINFVSRGSENLGVKCKVSKYLFVEPFKPGLITVALGGSTLSSFVQPQEFYTAQNIKVLIPKIKMSFNEKVFYCMAIKLNEYRYASHGREANKTLNYLLVPSKVPTAITQVEPELISASAISPKKYELATHNWVEFKLDSLFQIKSTQTTPLKRLKEYGLGHYPYVTTQAGNNGVRGFYNHYTEEGEVITVDSAALGYCAYQSSRFSASDHVEKLIPKFKMNKYIALFFVTLLNREHYRYSYGRKCNQTRIKDITIKLPEKNAAPDLKFMENYIKSLPYSQNLCKL